MKKLLFAILVTSLVSCGNLGSNPTENPASSDSNGNTPFVSISENPISNNGNNPSVRDVTSCTKDVDYPHKSSTISTEVVSKGRLTCGPTSQAVYATAKVSLYKSGLLYRTATKTISLSKVSSVSIPSNQLVAAGPCITGNYSATIDTTYFSASGGVVSFGLPASTPNVFVSC
jgi:hypothetical protein